MSKRKVLVIGGGVAGLSAAHHIARAGHKVVVMEKRKAPATTAPQLGGKAYSFQGSNGAAEHGFRFYPAFYSHVINTMADTPVAGGNVAQRLVGLRQAQIAADSNPLNLSGRITFPVPSSRKPALYAGTQSTLNVNDINPGHVTWLLTRLFTLPYAAVVVDSNPNANGSAPVRRDDDVSWWSFCLPNQYSAAYEAFFAVGLTRCFVATQATKMSARTGAEILMQIIYDYGHLGGNDADRAFDRPTSDAWFVPWRAALKDLNVKFKRREVTKLIYNAAQHRITSVATSAGNFAAFDDIVLAGAVDDARSLLANTPSLVNADEELTRLVNQSPNSALTTDAMNGIVFYPDAPLNGLIEGHYLVVESSWALTAVYQSVDWWKGPSTTGQIQSGQLSVILSDWHSPGSAGIAAEQASETVLADETWLQLQNAIPELVGVARPSKYTIDPARGPFVPNQTRPNTFPMLVNQTNAWKERPHAGLTGKVQNLYLAGDYVRATTDFASMETANEAARRAVRVFLSRHGGGPVPEVKEMLPTPAVVDAVRSNSSSLRRLSRLLGPILNDFGNLVDYNATDFGAWFAQNRGLEPIDELPAGLDPVPPGQFDDRWLPLPLRTSAPPAMTDPLSIREAGLQWAASLERVTVDLAKQSLLPAPLDVFDEMGKLLDFVKSRVAAFTNS